MIAGIEDFAAADPVRRWTQFLPEDPAASGPLSALIRGPLSTVPIDRVFPETAVAADIRFYITDSGTFYGVPPQGPDEASPNRYAPLPGGDLPRGVSVQPNLEGDILSLAANPYNQTTSLLSYPNQALSIEAGIAATAEVHSGALHESHTLVGYRSVEQVRALQWTYDSLRADPRPVYHVNVAGLDKFNYDRTNDRLGYRLTAIDKDGNRYTADGIDAEQATQLDIPEGTNLFKLPVAEPEHTYGAGLQVNLTDAPTGLYTMEVEYGLLRGDGDSFNGRMESQTFVYAHVNATESPFGAGSQPTARTSCRTVPLRCRRSAGSDRRTAHR